MQWDIARNLKFDIVGVAGLVYTTLFFKHIQFWYNLRFNTGVVDKKMIVLEWIIKRLDKKSQPFCNNTVWWRLTVGHIVIDLSLPKMFRAVI